MKDTRWKCMFCGDEFTGEDLDELKEMGETYFKTKTEFACPDCYDDLNQLPLEDRLQAVLEKDTYVWPQERRGIEVDHAYKVYSEYLELMDEAERKGDSLMVEIWLARAAAVKGLMEDFGFNLHKWRCPQEAVDGLEKGVSGNVCLQELPIIDLDR